MSEEFNNFVDCISEVQNPFTDKIISQLKSMTANNDHTGRVIKIAQILKNKKLEEVLNAIKVIHEYNRGMTVGLQKIRSDISVDLEKEIGKKYGKDIQDQVHMTG